MKAGSGEGAFGELGESCRGKKKQNKKVIGCFPCDVAFKPRSELRSSHKNAAKLRENGELLAEQLEQMSGI